jgi:hypothetical protein
MYTLNQTAWEPRADGFLPGATMGAETAAGIARYFVLSAVDKRVDLTGVEADIALSHPRLVGVPFSDGGDQLLDGLLGKAYHCQLVSEINFVRSLFQGRIFRPMESPS